MSMNSFHARQKKPRPAAQPAHERPAGMLRADALLVAQNLAPSRTAAQGLIKEGRVSWAGGVISKPALELPEATPLTVAADATLTIEAVPAACWCATCQAEFACRDFMSECPRCHNISGELRRGRELEIAAVELE